MSEPVVVCERNFATMRGGEEVPITVRWFQPESDGQDHFCRFSIQIGTGEPYERQIYGVDSVQALLLAMETVGVDLYIQDPPVFWFNPGDDLGLPVVDIIDEPRAQLVRRTGHANG